MLKKLAVAAMLAAGLSSTAAAVDLGGTYEVSGTNPNGSKYSGTAEIIVTSENTCRITCTPISMPTGWIISSGRHRDRSAWSTWLEERAI